MDYNCTYLDQKSAPCGKVYSYNHLQPTRPISGENARDVTRSGPMGGQGVVHVSWARQWEGGILGGLLNCWRCDGSAAKT